MERRLFRPTGHQIIWLVAVGFSSVGYALYLRYFAIELSSVALACDAGLQSWLCLARKIATVLFNQSAFGWVALAAALINLVRPVIPVFAVALVAAGFGLVLYNAGLAALAIALLIVSLARPVRAKE